MHSDLFKLVQECLFVRETDADFQKVNNLVHDEDTAFKKIVIGSKTPSTDLFDFSMYLYDCPPEKGGRNLQNKVYFPCKKMNKIFNRNDIVHENVAVLNLCAPIEMSFLYKPIISDTELNLYHFSLCFTDANGCLYGRNNATNAQRSFAKKCACAYLRNVMLVQACGCKAWDKKNDKKLYKFSDETIKYNRLDKRMLRWCRHFFSNRLIPWLLFKKCDAKNMKK